MSDKELNLYVLRTWGDLYEMYASDIPNADNDKFNGSCTLFFLAERSFT